MIGNIVRFERDSKILKGLVFCYMGAGGPEMKEPYIKAYLIERGQVNHSNIHLIRLDDESLEVLTLDRELGANMGKKYASSATNSKDDN